MPRCEWLAGQADTLGFDPGRLAVMGDSAGGGLAAGVCLMARDRGGPALAQQLLIYPMLDDRPSAPDPAMTSFLTWTYDDNLTGWGALLGQKAGRDDVSPYAAPARATDLAGLPPTYVDVGDLDIFRDEDIDYVRRLSDAGRADRVPSPSRLPARIRGPGVRNRRGVAHTRRPHPPASISVTATAVTATWRPSIRRQGSWLALAATSGKPRE